MEDNCPNKKETYEAPIILVNDSEVDEAPYIVCVVGCA